MSFRYKGRTRRVLLLLTCASLACRFLIPVGYMPAAIGEGWPVRMCFSGLPANLFPHTGDHHEHNKTDDVRWENCPLGALFSAVAISTDYQLQVAYLRAAPMPVTYAWHSIDTTVVAFRSRAPPIRIL